MNASLIREQHRRGLTLASRSRHVGGVTVVMCDGRVQFIADDIALSIWRNLSTARGRELIGDY